MFIPSFCNLSSSPATKKTNYGGISSLRSPMQTKIISCYYLHQISSLLIKDYITLTSLHPVYCTCHEDYLNFISCFYDCYFTMKNKQKRFDLSYFDVFCFEKISVINIRKQIIISCGYLGVFLEFLNFSLFREARFSRKDLSENCIYLFLRFPIKNLLENCIHLFFSF